jgi:hypothetical protein
MDKKLLKQYKSTFHFGASVRYEKILVRGYGKDEFSDGTELGTRVHKIWEQKKVSARAGIVVGWRWLSNGIGNYDSDNGNCYTATESLFAIEVKRAMMNKVDLVLPESLVVVGEQILSMDMLVSTHNIPDCIPTMSDKDRKWLSNEMKLVPRDSRGRWK